MTITIGVFTGLIAIVATVIIALEGQHDCHRWGPWFAVAAGLLAMAVSS